MTHICRPFISFILLIMWRVLCVFSPLVSVAQERMKWWNIPYISERLLSAHKIFRRFVFCQRISVARLRCRAHAWQQNCFENTFAPFGTSQKIICFWFPNSVAIIYRFLCSRRTIPMQIRRITIAWAPSITYVFAKSLDCLWTCMRFAWFIAVT